MATRMAEIPPTSLPIIIGTINSGATPAVNPKWSPNVKDAETAKAILITFPRLSMLFTVWNMAMLLTKRCN